MTHPFHPWSGRTFDYLLTRRTWSQDRVYFLLEDGTQASLPTAWTDIAEPDVFVTASAGRSAFCIRDLLALVELIEVLRPARKPKKGVRRT